MTESELDSFLLVPKSEDTSSVKGKGPIGFRLHTPYRSYVFGAPEWASVWLESLSLCATLATKFNGNRNGFQCDQLEPDYAKPLVSFARIPTTEFVRFLNLIFLYFYF